MKTAIYYRPNGVIQQVSTGPDVVEFPAIDGLSILLMDGDVQTAGKIVANGELVDGFIDDRTDAQRLAENQAKAKTLLAGSDWVVARAYERQEPVSVPWSAYREALRVIAQMTVYAEPVWPTAPNSAQPQN